MVSILRSSQLQAYQSYPEAWAAPVAFPLGVGLLVQIRVYIDYRKKKRNLPVAAAMILETLFTICCLVSCVANAYAQSYVGGTRVCAWQGFYATLYTFGSLACFVICFWDVCVHLSFRRALKFLTFGGIASLLLASLPMWWSSSSYIFAVDFCLENIEELPYATFYTICYSGGLVFMLVHGWNDRHSAHRAAKIATILYYFVFMMPSQIIAFSTFAGTPATGNYRWLYGALAILLHCNQSFVPLIFGWFWTYRRNKE